MTHLQCVTVVTALARKLYSEGSWCGETHVQKAVYFLQRLLERDLGYQYVLYKHGPFSFDLRCELTVLRAEHFIERRSAEPQYGPRLVVTQLTRGVWEKYYRTLDAWESALSFVATEVVSDKGVVELERLATALYVLVECADCETRKVQIRKLRELKPHVDEDEASDAFTDIEILRQIAAEKQVVGNVR